MKTSLVCLWMFCAAIVAPSAMAASPCPFIRPGGLSAQQVDATVVGVYAGWLHQPVAQLDTSRTVRALDSSDGASLNYSLATLEVGQDLGFDALKLFFDAAKAKGAKNPFESMSIAEMQGLARRAYAQGRDEPPPPADARAEYAVGRLPVRVPSAPGGDWRLAHCAAGDVTFMRRGSDGAFAASLRDTSLSPWVSDAAFLKQVADGLRGHVSPQFKLRPWQPAIVKGTAAPCADVAMTGDDAAEALTLYLRVRICYLRPDNPNLWLILFSETLPAGKGVDTAAAEAFVAATSPK